MGKQTTKNRSKKTKQTSLLGLSEPCNILSKGKNARSLFKRRFSKTKYG